MKYLKEFLQISSHGTQAFNQHRYWPKMIKDSEAIWELVKKKKSETASDKLSIERGVRDQLNRHFASEIYQSKRLKKKLKKKNEPIPAHLTAVIPPYIADLIKNDPNSLLNPYLELEAYVSEIDTLAVPQRLQDHYHGHNIQQISEVHLNDKEILKKSYFILFNLPSGQNSNNPTVGRVNSIWCIRRPSKPCRYILHASILKRMENLNEWYQMAEFRVTEQSLFVNAKEVESCLNLQHNCHDGDCKLTKTRKLRIERNDSEVRALETTHQDNKRFILNSCSLHSVNSHQKISGLVFKRIKPLQWIDTLPEGLNKWKANKKKGKPVIPSRPSTSRVDPSFLI
ncbi:hypothetical protein PtA15_1A514 [Puccinia triticina]|uniref:Uncharacterized protein n=1 Tax=Puccinia triticina TaxID=208348 RepID=A0ABY7C7M6_9BASI|nr:uncharacterized protein PtA15_1A514 [Puccinia triticina]WAQ81175.1 hypothetical protein PtA15_1A514 [Puccinia triticina]